MIEDRWLGFGVEELEVERQQLLEEGAQLSESMTADLKALLAEKSKDSPAYNERVRSFLEASAILPSRQGYFYHEPSALSAIQASMPEKRTVFKPINLSEAKLYDHVYGAWLGRSSGCLLGKPIEGLFIEDTWPYLKKTGQFPLTYYLGSNLPNELKEKYTFDTGRGYIDQIDHMVEDDDMNYTVTSLAVMAQFGWDFTPDDVATFWLDNLPAYHTFTAERVAYRNFLLVKRPPFSAFYCNPYREWIGAQIRGDFWGYICPGDPQKAAELAWRDACISHVKNGIYGEMWVAAMCAAAAVLETPRQVLDAGLDLVPEHCRLRANVEEVIKWYDTGIGVEKALSLIHQNWDDTNFHHWCHTLSNAQIVTLGLLYGENDFEKSISWAVTAGFDTDCNGATVGSILGMLHGASRLPHKWIDPLNDRLDTGIRGYHHVRISELAQQTIDFVISNKEIQIA